MTFLSITDNKTVNATHNIPVNGSKILEGKCSNETQMIKVATTDSCTFTLTFVKDKEMFELSEMKFVLNGTSLNAKGK